jgi:hypothetical protein
VIGMESLHNMRSKRAELANQVVMHIILVALIFALFLMATADKVNARGVKQQVLEKQVALLIDSAVPGMSFEIDKINIYGKINSMELNNGKVLIGVEGLSSKKGYPYFSRYSVNIREESDKFVVIVNA